MGLLQDSQVERFLPHGVQVSVDGLGSLLGFAHLHRDVGVAGAGAVFSLQTLSAHYCSCTDTQQIPRYINVKLLLIIRAESGLKTEELWERYDVCVTPLWRRCA